MVYELDAEDRVTARNKRDSRLAVAAHLPARFSEGVRTYGALSSSYAYSFQQAKKKMKRAELQYQLKPYVESYFGECFSDGKGSFDEWIGDMDRQIDDLEANGPENFGNTLIALELSYPANLLGAWLKAPEDKKHPAYMDMSRSLQRKLKELLPFYYFQDPDKYEAIAAAAPLLAYAAIPPSTNIRLQSGSLTLNTDNGIYWDFRDPRKRSAMLGNDRTRDRLSRDLQRVFDRLQNLGRTGTAQFYKEGQLGSLLNAATDGVGGNLLESLLFVEAEIVSGAHKAARKIAKFVSEEKPSKAVESLAEFGANVTKTFNARVKSVYGAGALRPLGPMLLVEAARALDPSDTPREPNAMLCLSVLKKELDFPPKGFPNHELPTSAIPGEGPLVIEERLVHLGFNRV